MIYIRANTEHYTTRVTYQSATSIFRTCDCYDNFHSIMIHSLISVSRKSFLPDFQETLKRMLQNFQKISKNSFLDAIYVVINSIGFILQPRNSQLSVARGLMGSNIQITYEQLRTILCFKCHQIICMSWPIQNVLLYYIKFLGDNY